MDAMIFQTGYSYDDYGYYLGDVDCQITEGVFLPPNVTLSKPALKEGYWYKYDAETDGWKTEKIPQTPKDAVGIEYDADDSVTTRGYYLRNLMLNIPTDSDYYCQQDDEKHIWKVVKKHAKTLEQVREEKLQELSGKYNYEQSDCVVYAKLSDGKVLALNVSTETIQSLQVALIMVQNGVAYNWVDDNGKITVFNTVDDVVICLSAINTHNTEMATKWAEYKQKIEQAKSIKALNAIDIVFHTNTENNEVKTNE